MEQNENLDEEREEDFFLVFFLLSSVFFLSLFSSLFIGFLALPDLRPMARPKLQLKMRTAVSERMRGDS